MTPSIQRELLLRLGEVCDLSPDVRFGQLLDHLGLLCEDRQDQTLAVIDDEQLLEVMDEHLEELKRRAGLLQPVR